MMKNSFAAVLLLLQAAAVFSFQWPLKDPVITVSFGENRYGSFTKGIEIQGADDDVRAISSGEIVFYNSPGNGDGLPSPLGNYTVIRHDRGIYSIYSHLDKVFADNKNILEGNVIGTMGATGMSTGKSLFLVILDSEFEQYINPLLSLPPLADTVRPQIGRILFSKNGTDTELSSGYTLEKGRYMIKAEIKDFGINPGYYCPLAPYSINLYINGENKKTIRFESLQVKGGKILLSGEDETAFSMVYEGPWIYNIGSFVFSPGDTRIEIAVKDFEGNEASRIISLRIKE